jgi:hypothetical protein
LTASGSIILGDLAQRTAVLEVGCSRCGRAGRYPLAPLIERHGAAFPVPMLLLLLSADCPKRQSISVYDLCGVHCPELAALFGVMPPSQRATDD